MMQLLQGDCLTMLATLPAQSVQTVVTSPPYYGLRDYGHDGQLGLEETPAEYVAKLVEVFRQVRRVLRDDGTVWLNLGDSYARPLEKGGSGTPNGRNGRGEEYRGAGLANLKAKDLIGIPWSVAKALQEPYYSGNMKRERDRAWMAATIDGEGTICGFEHERKDDGRVRTGVNICITNSSTAMLDEADRIWSASRSEHCRPGAGHLGLLDTYRWIVHGTENRLLFLRELYPYLIVKKRQALLAYNLLLFMQKAKQLGHSPQAAQVREMRSQLVSLMSDANNGRSFDIPAWCVEPPPVYEPGWYLRSDIIWHKPNPMPESVTDRPTKAHEYIFLLSKSERYFYDAEAVKEQSTQHAQGTRGVHAGNKLADHPTLSIRHGQDGSTLRAAERVTRNRRTVWTVSTKPFSGAHFATFPMDLIEPCILAGTSAKGCCPECGKGWERVVERETAIPQRSGNWKATGQTHRNDLDRKGGFYPDGPQTTGWQQACDCPAAEPVPCVVLDPFAGAGTTGVVSVKHGRAFVGVELNPDYWQMAKDRIEAEIARPKQLGLAI